jgi:hypothetical protein
MWLNGEAIMSKERELTIDELDAVSGGADGTRGGNVAAGWDMGKGGTIWGGPDGGGGGAGPAIDAWNTLLHQYGY